MRIIATSTAAKAIAARFAESLCHARVQYPRAGRPTTAIAESVRETPVVAAVISADPDTWISQTIEDIGEQVANDHDDRCERRDSKDKREVVLAGAVHSHPADARPSED